LIGARKQDDHGHLGVHTSLQLTTLETPRKYKRTVPPGARPMPLVRESDLTTPFQHVSKYFVDCAAIKRLVSTWRGLEQWLVQLQTTVARHQSERNASVPARLRDGRHAVFSQVGIQQRGVRRGFGQELECFLH
jgi:hypothetical protein